MVETDDVAATSAAATASFDFAMPSLGSDMEEGRVIEWRVAPGDTVHRGDLMALVETEKSDIDIEIWHDGIVEEFLVDIGDLVDVGTPIVRLRAIAGSTPAPTPAPIPSTPGRPEAPAAVDRTPSARRSVAEHPLPPPASAHVARPTTDRIPASPLARRLAAERGLDLATIHGSGPAGAVIEADVLTAASPPAPSPPAPSPPAPASDRRRSADTMRSVIAERMATSNREIPHYHLSRDLDVGPLESWLAERNAGRPISDRVLPAACFIRAVALAAARHRELNGFWIDDHFEPADSVNVAMAISLRRGGLVTPHVEHADERTLEEVMAALTERVAGARAGTLRASWMTGATLTITHLGDTGADLVHGVISPPQVALVGFGRARPRPWSIDDSIVTRPIVTSTLAADHRATDGAVGSRFLATLADLIDHPEQL